MIHGMVSARPSLVSSSSEPERVFSGAKHTIIDQRTSMKIESVILVDILLSKLITSHCYPPTANLYTASVGSAAASKVQ